jgi:hypothetical protein
MKTLIDEGINWQTLLDLAKQHGVRPLLFRSLKSVCWLSVPQSTQLELEQFNRANVQRSLHYIGVLFQLLGEFQQNHIPAAVFKGVVLAQTVYGDFSLREFNDMDIIVHEANVRRAEDILSDRGYVASFLGDYRAAFLNYQGQNAFHHRETGISVDLHWQLSNKGVASPLRASEIWPRLQNLTIAGHTIPTFAHDDLALFLAAHGTKEGWRSLNWVCDFAELFRNCRDIDWTVVTERAQRSQCMRPLLLAITLASALLDAPAPLNLVHLARNNSAVRKLADKAQLKMLQTSPEAEIEQFFNGLNTYDRFTQRLRPIVTLLCTRSVGDYQAMPLPKSLWGLYYITRPFRLAGEIAGMMLRNVWKR